MAFVEPTKFTWVVDENGKKRKKAARDTSWRARYIDPSGHARGKTFPRKYDAEQFLAQNTTSIQQGDWADPALKRTRFSEWADMWWATTPKLAPSTRRGYERMLRIYIRPVFNDRPIASIDWNEVELFIAKLVNENLSPKTVRHAVSVLTLVMQTAMRSKAIRENPAVGHTLWKIIDRSRRNSALPPFRPYDLRHSHASLLIELGAHPKAISERMGHSEIGVTMDVYGHLFQGAQAKLTNDLSGLVEETRREPPTTYVMT